MKLTILFVSILLASALYTSAKIQKEQEVRHSQPDQDEKMTNFLTGFFNHFGLSQPNEILKCFSDDGSKLFFRTFWTIRNILQDTNDKKVSKFDFNLFKGKLLEGAFQDTITCIRKTQDFLDLLNAVNIKKSDSKHMDKAIYVYYQAHPNQLLEDFEPVIESLKGRNPIAAGDAFATMISNMVDAIHDEGWIHLAYIAFSNGQASELGIEKPKDSLQCFDNDSAGSYLVFTYKLADAVARGTWEESAQSANEFWKKEGEAIMNKIPASVWECWGQSEDAKALKDKLGVDVGDMSFINLMLKYNENRQFSYYAYMKSLKSAFDDVNFDLAGTIDAQYTKAIVAFKDK